MDTVDNRTMMSGGTPAPNENGKWVPVDPNSLGFNADRVPVGGQFQGADGSVYRVGQTAPQYQSVASNANNAIPTPSSIVQMPPIVQPIALVPYTSQNQPMLQYDPYSRPQDPNIAPKAPNYVKKPYRGISLACFIIAIVSGILMTLLSVAVFKENDMRVAGSASGADLIAALLKLAGGESINSYYYNVKIEQFVFNGQWNNEMLSTVVTFGIIIATVAVIVIDVVLFFKYVTKFAQKKSPRCFSVLALLNIILCLAIMGLILGMSDAEVKIDGEYNRDANVAAFFEFNSTIYSGIGLVIALISSIALLILPKCCKKNAYMVEKSEDDKTYILNNM